MSTIEAPAPPKAQVQTQADRRKHWTTTEFDRMVRAGIIEEGSRTYLWEGEVYEPMTINPAHRNAVGNLSDLLRARLPRADWTIEQDAPVDLEDGTKPQPDVMVIAGPRSRYRGRKIKPADMALLVEVSDTTYDRDRGPRWLKNAQTGIPVYWIVNIPERKVEVYTNPETGPDGSPRYRDRAEFGLGAVVPLVLSREGVVAAYEGVRVDDILVDSLEPPDEGQRP
jgi:Uma2 family endonuclease